MFDATRRSWRVDLPSYFMVHESWLPIVPDLIDKNGVHAADANGKPIDPAVVLAEGPSVAVDLPDDWPLDNQGQIDAEAFRAIYAGTRFGGDDYVPPRLLAP